YAPHDGEFGLYTITRTDERLAMQSPGQPPMDLYPTSETDFTMKFPDLQIAFTVDGNGGVTQLVMRTQGLEIVARRVDSAEADAIQARLAERIRSNVPRQGSKEALHRLAEGIRAGAPPYEEMSPAFAQVIERQLARLQPIAAYLGPIRSIEFQGIGSQGWDVYDLHRERGTGRWRIALGSDGKIYGAMATLTSPLTLGP